MTLADDIVWLIDIPSPTGSEAVLRDAISDRLSGLPQRRIGRSLVVGEGGTAPLVALYGHLDTVPEQGNLPARSQDGRLIGLGSVDMKSGLAVMIALLEDPDVAGGPFDLTAVFYDGEEGPFDQNGLEAVLDASSHLQQAEVSLVLEPTGGELQLGCQGVVNAEVVFTGESAHSARPWLGRNAITRAGKWLTEMDSLPAAEVEVDALVFRETFAVTRATGGMAHNVIPDSFRLLVNHRFPPDRGLDEAEARLRSVCAAADEVRIVDRAPAAPVPKGNPHLERLAGLARAVAPKTAWTDVARLAGRGLDAANFGPGDPALAHKAEESIDPADAEEALGVLKRLLV